MNNFTKDLTAFAASHKNYKYNYYMKYIYSGLANNPQNIMYHVRFEIPFGRYVLCLDIVVSPDPIQTIENFDLSFCKAYVYSDPDKKHEILTRISDPNDDISLFDSNILRVEFVDPNGIFKRSGSMSEPFAKEYYDGNITTRNRVNKYLQRGYTISIPTLNSENVIHLNPSNKIQLTKNRNELSKSIKVIRSIMMILTFPALEADIAWIAEHYEETKKFAIILSSYIKNEIVKLQNENNDNMDDILRERNFETEFLFRKLFVRLEEEIKKDDW